MTFPSVSVTGLGLRFTSGDVSLSISEPSASVSEGPGIWSWNSKLQRVSWTLGENRRRLALARRSERLNSEVLQKASPNARLSAAVPIGIQRSPHVEDTLLGKFKPASRRRSRVVGKITSHYLPRT